MSAESMTLQPKTGDRKQEFLELAYDLVFAYLVKRCDALLPVTDSGFFTAANLMLYLLASLVVLQIWVFSTRYINRYEKGNLSTYVFGVINMYLLCFLAVDTSETWASTYTAYHIAWGLIMILLGVQYLRQLLNLAGNDRERDFVRKRALVAFIQAAVILLCLPFFTRPVQMWHGWIALGIGYVGSFLVRRLENVVAINVEHLIRRIMAFVVICFGETLASVIEYFSGGMTVETIYFSTCVFLSMIAMLTSYGFVYTKVLERDNVGVGMNYMVIHVFIIVVINNIAVGFDLLRHDGTDGMKVIIFLIISFAVYYATHIILAGKAGASYLSTRKAWVPYLITSAVFVGLMFCFVSNRWVMAALSAIYPFVMFTDMYSRWLKDQKKQKLAARS